MKTIKRQKRTGWIAVLTAALLLWLASVSLWADASGERPKELVITVVEDIPAADIEDNMVPLAAGPGDMSAAAPQSGYRHACLMGLVLGAAIAYALYFRSLQAEVFRLRIRAAEAERQALKSRGAGPAGQKGEKP